MADKVSKGDIESLAEKLEVFADSLPDGERDALAQMLENGAQASGEETSGFAASFGSPTSWSLAQGLGTQVQPGISQQYFPRGAPGSLRKE